MIATLKQRMRRFNLEKWIPAFEHKLVWPLWKQIMGIREFLNSRRKCWTLDSGRWTLNPGLWTHDAGRWMLDVGCWTLDATLWTLGSGRWTLSLTVLEQNQKPVSDSAWLNYWKFFGCESLRTTWSRLLYRDYRFWFGYF